LIVENGRTHRTDLQGLGNAVQVRLGLEWRPDEYLRKCLLDLSSVEQGQILADIATLVGYTDSWTSIGRRLRWVARLLRAIPKSNEQKELVQTLYLSAWTALCRHNDGHDYFGKSPFFAPVVSLDTYKTAFKESLESLKSIQKTRNEFFQELDAQTDATNNLNAALTAANNHQTALGTTKKTSRTSWIKKIRPSESWIRS
jgi:hypothetical protein